MIPQITRFLTKSTKARRCAWLVALATYLACVVPMFLIPSEVDKKSFIAAAVALLVIPAVRALTLVVADAVVLTDEDKRLIPKVHFLSENGILTQEDLEAAKAA